MHYACFFTFPTKNSIGLRAACFVVTFFVRMFLIVDFVAKGIIHPLYILDEFRKIVNLINTYMHDLVR